MKHVTKTSSGTDARNYVVRCSCGWAYSSTFLSVAARQAEHMDENNPLAWNNMRRRVQPDRTEQS